MKQLTYSVSGATYSIIISDNLSEIEASWNKLNHSNIYSDSPYLKLLEKSGPIGYQYYYAIVNQNNLPIACFYFQKKTLKLVEDFRIHTHSKNWLPRLRVAFLKNLFKLVNHEFLVSGNVLLTGEYAFNYTIEIPDDLADKIFKEVVVFIKEKTGKKIKTILQKDFYSDKNIGKLKTLGTGFTELVVQPDMIFINDQSWDTYADYLKAVRSKYRVKFKKIKKKFKGLEIYEMDQEMADKYNGKMYALYKATADRALFSVFTLSPNYFKDLKSSFGDQLKLFGVFEEEKLLGFFTFVKHKNSADADAHFLGYDVSRNAQYQLYFNMLLRLIEEAILQKVNYLNLSRTAVEIKSSVGAVPFDMKLYLKHTNSILNKTVAFFLSFTVPKNEWVLRSPFGKKE